MQNVATMIKRLLSFTVITVLIGCGASYINEDEENIVDSTEIESTTVKKEYIHKLTKNIVPCLLSSDWEIIEIFGENKRTTLAEIGKSEFDIVIREKDPIKLTEEVPHVILHVYKNKKSIDKVASEAHEHPELHIGENTAEKFAETYEYLIYEGTKEHSLTENTDNDLVRAMLHCIRKKLVE